MSYYYVTFGRNGARSQAEYRQQQANLAAGRPINEGLNIPGQTQGSPMIPALYGQGVTGYGASGQTAGGPGSGSMSVTGASPELYGAYGVPQGGSSSSGSSSASTSNPYEASAMGFLQQVLSGQRLPYDEATQANMLTQASDMSGAAEAAQNQQAQQQAVAGGASATDPSLQGLAREYMAQRQGQNQQSANNIAQTASRANFGAQQDAARTMADYGLAQQDRQYRAQAALRSGAYDSTRGGSTANPSGSRVQGYGATDMQDFNASDPYGPEAAQYRQQRNQAQQLQPYGQAGQSGGYSTYKRRA